MSSAIPDIGCVSLADGFVDGFPVLGLVRNPNVYASQALSITFEIEPCGDAIVSRADAWLDGENIGAAYPGAWLDTPPLEEGAHEISVALRAPDGNSIQPRGDGFSRAALAWNAPAGAESYAVYWDAGTGTISYTTPLDTTTATRWTSPVLTTGTYKFAVKALDAAGNASGASGVLTVSAPGAPEPPTGVSATWNPATRTIHFEWTPPAVYFLTACYCNFSNIFEEFETNGYIFEDSPIFTADAIDGEYDLVLPGSAVGTFKFYLRSISETGIEEHNCALQTLECGAAALAALDAPLMHSGEPAAGGAVCLTVGVARSQADPTAIAIYTLADDSWDTPTLLQSVAYTGGQDFPIEYVEITTAALPEALTYFGARAVDALGNESENSNILSATPDATPPAAPVLTGGLL